MLTRCEDDYRAPEYYHESEVNGRPVSLALLCAVARTDS